MLTKWSREITLFVCSWFFARFDARFNDFEYLLLNTVPHTHSSNWVIAFAESPWLGVLASFSDRKVAIYKAISPLLCKCTQLFFFLMRLLVLGCISCRWVYTYSTYNVFLACAVLYHFEQLIVQPWERVGMKCLVSCHDSFYCFNHGGRGTTHWEVSPREEG